MKTRPKLLLTAALSVGALALLLGAAAGSQTDPLVTMSYLNDVLTMRNSMVKSDRRR